MFGAQAAVWRFMHLGLKAFRDQSATHCVDLPQEKGPAVPSLGLFIHRTLFRVSLKGNRAGLEMWLSWWSAQHV